MSIKRMVTKRFCLAFGAALTVAGVLVTQSSGSTVDPLNAGVVYVYFPSLCAAPGDSNDCREIPQPKRPSFESMEACSAHADVELRRDHDPRVMASCMRQREV
jgi:hypothetical protein